MKSLLCCSLALLGTLAHALDVRISEYECDSSLPVTAEFFVECSGSDRCTFGNKALVYGTLYYNGVESSGIENNVAYISSDLSFLTIDYALFDMMSVPLCHENMDSAASNYYDCPGDGAYTFSVPYRLPNTGKNTASWLATGWEGSGFIRMYAEQDENMLIGECLLTLQTMMTPDHSNDNFLRTPSAAATVGIFLGVSAVLGLACMYCYCCVRRKEKTKTSSKKTSATVDPEDSLDAVFKRMEDEKATAGVEAATAKKWANPGRRSSNRSHATAPVSGSVPLM